MLNQVYLNLLPKIFISFLIIVALGISVSVICVSQTLWKQDQFIFGTFYDPPFDFNKKSFRDDSVSFQLAKDANFNLLTGTQGDGLIDHSYEGMKWAIKISQEVGLKYLITDRRVYEAYNNDFDQKVGLTFVNQYRFLINQYQNTIYGFDICDEPHYKSSHYKNVSAWKWFIESAFPEKLVYINLAPSYSVDQNWDGLKGGNNNGYLEEEEIFKYERYLDLYINNLQPSVVSFDHYPFFRNGEIRRDYFYNLRIIREKAGSKPFWACPMTIDHFNYIDPKEEHLYFMFFCPIAYGAKGLIVFTFWPLIQKDFRAALFDRNGIKTYKYDIVARLNLFIKDVIAPVVMKVPNVGVYHSSCYPPNQQLLLDTLNANSKDLIYISDEKVMVGVFKDNKVTYLFIVNKSLMSISDIKIGIKGITQYVYFSPSISDFKSNTSLRYKKIATTINRPEIISSFSIPKLSGGEGRLVRIR